MRQPSETNMHLNYLQSAKNASNDDVVVRSALCLRMERADRCQSGGTSCSLRSSATQRGVGQQAIGEKA